MLFVSRTADAVNDRLLLDILLFDIRQNIRLLISRSRAACPLAFNLFDGFRFISRLLSVVPRIAAAFEETNPFANLWSLKANDNARQALTANKGFHSDFASISADGKHVYFNANRNRQINIWRMDASGENLRQSTDATDGLQLFPAISPDGNFLYYLFRNRERAVVKRLNLIENKEETFFENTTLMPGAFLTLSPDGKYLAFLNLNNEADEDTDENNFQFAVASRKNPADIRFFNVKANGSTAHFSPGGKFLDYVSYAAGESKILRQNLEGEAPAEIFKLPKERIFNFAWSRDGAKLAFSRGHQFRDAVLLTGFE